MIRITAIDVPQSHSSIIETYGRDYMASISPATAANLCGPYGVPLASRKTVVANNVTMASRPRLCVANVGAVYFICCAGWKMNQWPEIFDVEVVRA